MLTKQHSKLSNQSDQEEQELSSPSNKHIQSEQSNFNQFKNELILMITVLILLFCGRSYIRFVMYPQAVENQRQRYQSMLQNSVNISQMLAKDIPELYANELTNTRSMNEELSYLINLLQNNEKKSSFKPTEKTFEKQVPQLEVDSELQQFQQTIKQAIPTNIQDKKVQNIPGFKQVADITAEKVIAAKKYRRLIDEPLDSQSQSAINEYQYYQQQYQIDLYEQLPFCIVVPTYNNEVNERYKRNLNSIIQQNYLNYHVVIIQDASSDNTGKLIDDYVKLITQKYPQKHFENRIQVIHNQVEKRALPNLRRAAMQFCQPKEIFLIVDGDDQLIGRQVLKLFNSQFQSQKIWFMYTNSITHIGSVGFSRPIRGDIKQKNWFRKSAFVTSHLRAYYTQLFRLIKQQDLKDEDGEFFRAANDVAICIPILEMCHKKIAYVPQITYLYNSNTGFNNHRIRLKQQTENNRRIRTYPSYQPLQQLFAN